MKQPTLPDLLTLARALPPPRRSRSESPTIRLAESAYEAVLGALILDALRTTGGDRTRAAKALEMKPANLMRLLRVLDLDAPAVRPGPKRKRHAP